MTEHDLKCLSIEELEKHAAQLMDKQTRDYYNEVGALGITLLTAFVNLLCCFTDVMDTLALASAGGDSRMNEPMATLCLCMHRVQTRELHFART